MQQPSANSADPPYNPIFEKMLEAAGDDRLRGLVAYGLYKTAKREWARELQDREGRKPTDEELRAYIRHWTPTQMDNVQQMARQTLAEYAAAVIEAEEPRILRQALQGTFWRSV